MEDISTVKSNDVNNLGISLYSPVEETSMTIIRGIGFVAVCWILFAIGGGLIAVTLNQFAPGYCSGVFPFAARDGYAADVGVGTGVLQGQALGLVVGFVVAVGLGWLRQLGWLSAGRALVILAGCAAGFGVVGGLVGWAIGVFSPGYYRAVISGGRQPDFNPIDVGIGLGISQGMILGVIIGGIVTLALAWRRSRAEGPSAPHQALQQTGTA
jgi:hypothetical protein